MRLRASDFRYHSLENMGVKMEGGAFAGLYARAVIVLDENHQVIHCELVSEVTDEPDYDQAMSAFERLIVLFIPCAQADWSAR